MKKNVGFLLLAIMLAHDTVLCQDDHTQRPALGIYFFFHDFTTAADIRASSLRSVFRNGQFGKLKDMSPGLALNYMTGLSAHFDFTTLLTGTFLDYFRKDGALLGEDNLLVEGDASVKAKLFSNRYWITPFLQLGAGISKYKSYWGSFIPAGTGFQVNLFEEAYFMFNAQYRIGVTNTVSDHFFYSIGIAGILGRKKTSTVLPD
jgi:hypothetical protein